MKLDFKTGNDSEKKNFLEEIEQQTRQKLEKKIPVGVWEKIAALAENINDRITSIGLPVGLNIEQYKIIREMFEEMQSRVIFTNKRVVRGPGWVRFIEDQQDTTIDTRAVFNSKVDILDMLLERYLPELVKDQRKFTELRIYFLFETGVVPYLA